MLWGVAILLLAFVHSYQCGSAKNVIKRWVINLMLVAQRQNKTALIYSPPLHTWHWEVREGVCRSVIICTSCLWLMWKPHLLASWMRLSQPYLARSIHLALAERQRRLRGTIRAAILPSENTIKSLRWWKSQPPKVRKWTHSICAHSTLVRVNNWREHQWLLDESGKVSSYRLTKVTEQEIDPFQETCDLKNQSQSVKTSLRGQSDDAPLSLIQQQRGHYFPFSWSLAVH